MTVLGLDYSQGRPTGAQVRAAGYSFVARYLDNGLGGRTNLSAAEVNDMHANGVAVAMVWESTASRALQGLAAGAADAANAAAAARAVGLDGTPIYFAVDFDLSDYSPFSTDPLVKLGPVGAYFQGVRSALPLARVGVYGGYWAVSRVLNAGLARYAWQTLAWSGGHIDSRIHLLQNLNGVTVGGVGCDVNEARQAEFGQHAATAPLTSTPGDIVFQFIVNGDTFTKPATDPTADNPNVLLLLGGGYVTRATWADVRAKDKSYGGDGTGSVLGKPAADYQKLVDLDTAVRTRDVHLINLATGTGTATPAPVYDIALEPSNVVVATAVPRTP